MTADLQPLPTVLFLVNNDETTDQEVTVLAQKNNTTNRGLITDPTFIPTTTGYYHTTIVDIPIGSLIDLAKHFDEIVMLDQPQAQWSHWKLLLGTFKAMNKLEEVGLKTVFRNNANSKKIQFWIDLLYKKNKSFCIYPWINFHDTGPHLKTCSRDASYVTSTVELKDWRTDPKYTAIRQKMIDGVSLPEHCKCCYEYEDLGIESYRQFESLDWIFQLDVDSIDDLQKIEYPYFYEIHIGNNCNLKCRGCEPGASNLIGEELKKYNIVTPIKLEWEPKTATIDEIKIDTLTEKSTVYFHGGEPSIMPEVLEFMHRCIAKGRTDFNLTMCTNGLKFTDKFLDAISHFKNTNFSFSLDGYGPVNDYWRSGSKWEKIIANAHLLKSRGHFISINTVPGIYNVTNLHLLLEFLDREFPFTAIYMQINYLKWQSAFNHPNKELVIESMKRCMNTSVYHSNGKSCKTAIDSIYNHYMGNPTCNLDDLKDFFDYNDQLDRVRKVKLGDYIPELEAARALLK